MQNTGKEVACVRFTLNVLCYSTVAQPRYQGQSNNGPWRPIWSLSMCDLIELNEATGARYSYLLWGGVGGCAWRPRLRYWLQLAVSLLIG